MDPQSHHQLLPVPSVLEDRQVELVEARGIGEHIDLDDLERSRPALRTAGTCGLDPLDRDDQRLEPPQRHHQAGTGPGPALSGTGRREHRNAGLNLVRLS